MTEKPPLPQRPFDPWPRIPVDTSTGTDFHVACRSAVSAGTQWVLGPEGPYKQELSLAEIVQGAVQEGLVHLLELGLIDIDHERLNAAHGWPTHRERPPTT